MAVPLIPVVDDNALPRHDLGRSLRQHGFAVIEAHTGEDAPRSRPVRREFGGLGLGLAIVRHLTGMHGGTVRAESAGAGQGATFSVVLPTVPR
jgi:signal transduction histidine kinase